MARSNVYAADTTTTPGIRAHIRELRHKANRANDLLLKAERGEISLDCALMLARMNLEDTSFRKDDALTAIREMQEKNGFI